MPTLNELVACYVSVCDAKNEIERRHKEELRPCNEMMRRLEGYMQQALDAQGTTSSSITGVGTCYKQKWIKAKVTDWEATLDWIVENDAWDLLTQAVSKTQVVERMTKVHTETGEITMVPCPIPGVEVDSGYKINVRRA